MSCFRRENVIRFPTDGYVRNHRLNPYLLRGQQSLNLAARRVSDCELVRRCILHDNSAWHELIRRHGGAVYDAIVRQLRNIAPSRNGHDAEDVLERVFEKLLERDCRVLRNLRDPRVLRAYLCRVARTVTVDHLRADPAVLQLTGAHEFGGTFADPREIASAQEKYKALEEVLHKLSDRQRLFLSLYYEQGLAYREIAELTATPIRTVGSVLHRARKAARSLLAKRGAKFPGRADA